jgi:hypothetical protein
MPGVGTGAEIPAFAGMTGSHTAGTVKCVTSGNSVARGLAEDVIPADAGIQGRYGSRNDRQNPGPRQLTVPIYFQRDVAQKVKKTVYNIIYFQLFQNNIKSYL